MYEKVLTNAAPSPQRTFPMNMIQDICNDTGYFWTELKHQMCYKQKRTHQCSTSL